MRSECYRSNPQIGLKGPIGMKMGFIARNIYEMASLEGFGAPGAVSYTHLTLPTILLV